MTTTQEKLIEQINAEMQANPIDHLLEDAGQYLLDYCAKNAAFAEKLAETYGKKSTADKTDDDEIAPDEDGDDEDDVPAKPTKKGKKKAVKKSKNPKKWTLADALKAHKEACRGNAVNNAAWVTLDDVLDFVWEYFELNEVRERTEQPQPKERRFGASTLSVSEVSKRLNIDLDELLA